MDNGSKFDNNIKTIERNLHILKGEVYKLEHDKIRKAGREARKAAMNIKNMCDIIRKELLKTMNDIPKQHHFWSKSSIKSMLEKKKKYKKIN